MHPERDVSDMKGYMRDTCGIHAGYMRDTCILSGDGHDVQLRLTAKKTKPPNPPPVGKAGFEVWVLTKGGLVSVCTTADCTVP